MKFIRKLLCRHRYIKIGYAEAMDVGVRFSYRLYRCEKCGKEKWIDGRFDRISEAN